jgi:hypothetical protein
MPGIESWTLKDETAYDGHKNCSREELKSTASNRYQLKKSVDDLHKRQAKRMFVLF